MADVNEGVEDAHIYEMIDLNFETTGESMYSDECTLAHNTESAHIANVTDGGADDQKYETVDGNTELTGDDEYTLARVCTSQAFTYPCSSAHSTESARIANVIKDRNHETVNTSHTTQRLHIADVIDCAADDQKYVNENTEITDEDVYTLARVCTTQAYITPCTSEHTTVSANISKVIEDRHYETWLENGERTGTDEYTSPRTCTLQAHNVTGEDEHTLAKVRTCTFNAYITPCVDIANANIGAEVNNYETINENTIFMNNTDIDRDDNTPARICEIQANTNYSKRKECKIVVMTIISLIVIAGVSSLVVILTLKPQDIDECSSAPCKNGATCEDTENGYTCSCTINWRGTQCDQTSDYGTDFYIGMYPFEREKSDVLVDIASQEDGNAVLSVPYLNIHRNVTITIGATTLKVDKSIMKQGTFIENRGIRIQTDVPVAIFVTIYGEFYSRMDTYLALPVTALGTSYKVASYHPLDKEYPAFYSVFGMRENTKVTTHFNNQSTSFTLKPFSVGQHANTTDLTDTYIQSDNIIAVISGTQCAYIPRNIYNCDYIVEQMVPTRHWVKHFIVPPVYPKQGFVLKIVTIYNETVCIKNTSNTICNFSSILPDAEMLMGLILWWSPRLHL